MDAQVTEHGVGFPAAKQHDGLCANIGTEKGGGTARTEGAGSDLFGEDTRVGFVNFGHMLDCIGDVGGLGRHGLVDGQVLVMDGVHGRGGLGVVVLKALGDACEGLSGAEEGVVVDTVANALAFDSVLLSDKFQGCRAQVRKLVIIQGRIGGIAHCSSDVEVDASEFKGLRVSVGSAGVAVFGWSNKKKATMMRSMT